MSVINMSRQGIIGIALSIGLIIWLIYALKADNVFDYFGGRVKVIGQSLYTFLRVHLLSLVLLVVCIPIIVYSINHWDTADYGANTISNTSATIVGLILGIPIALNIERWRQNQEAKKQKFDSEMKAKVVAAVIVDELQYNLLNLQNYIQASHKSMRHIITNHTWYALSNSGEIAELDNPKLLNEIARTYFFLDIQNKLFVDAYEVIDGRHPRYAHDSEQGQAIMRRPQKYAPNVIERLKRVIYEINQGYDLNNLPSVRFDDMWPIPDAE